MLASPLSPSTDPPDPIPLPKLARALRDRFGLAVPYTRLYRGAVDGELPIRQGANGRYSAAVEALPEIARRLGSDPSSQAAS